MNELKAGIYGVVHSESRVISIDREYLVEVVVRKFSARLENELSSRSSVIELCDLLKECLIEYCDDIDKSLENSL